jgi:hypothetical protein
MYCLYSRYSVAHLFSGGLVCGALASGHHVKSSERNAKQLEYLLVQHSNPELMTQRMKKCREDAACVYPYWSLMRQLWSKPLELDRHKLYQDVIEALLAGNRLRASIAAITSFFRRKGCHGIGAGTHCDTENLIILSCSRLDPLPALQVCRKILMLCSFGFQQCQHQWQFQPRFQPMSRQRPPLNPKNQVRKIVFQLL